MQVSIRPMTADDLPTVVRIHHVAFRGFFLDLMGPAFLRAYYANVLVYSNSIALVAEDIGGMVQGFAIGFIDPKGFYRYFREKRLRLLPLIVMALIRRPWLLGKILRNSVRVSQHEGDRESIATGELASIGCGQQGTGVGSALLKDFIAETYKRGSQRVVLTTDEQGNDNVRGFYQKHGFREAGREQRGDRTLIVYVFERK